MSDRLPDHQHHTAPADQIDKVTGQATYGDDITLPDSLVGKVLRSPHAHARILHRDGSQAREISGVHAVVTADDLPAVGADAPGVNDPQSQWHNLSADLLARDKALYEGHAIAAVAADSEEAAQRALDAIAIEYEVLPHVIDVRRAMEPDAPLLHPSMYTNGIDPPPDQPSNIASRYQQLKGDPDAAFRQADLVIDEEFTTQPVHQGDIEPQACTARCHADGRAEIWSATHSPFMVRSCCAQLLEMDPDRIRVSPMERGGVFGGRTTACLEPLALLLACRSRRPVSMRMSRAEVFTATGTAPGSYALLKLGARRDGRIVAAEGILCYQAGAYPGSPVEQGCISALAPYDIADIRMTGYDVVANQPGTGAVRAPGAPMAAFAAESLIDKLARRLGMDPLTLREKNAAHEGTRTANGTQYPRIGYRQTLKAAREHPHYHEGLDAHQGRGIASGGWRNQGGGSSADAGIHAHAVAPAFGTHICDVTVDPETGRATILRYTVIQDVGRAIHPAHVEARLQGGAARGIGWALYEEKVHDESGRVQNPDFRDYRMPVAPDLPGIDTVLVEEPDPHHPFGVRGVGEASLVPALAAVANAVADATGRRVCDLPLSPSRVLAALSRPF